MTASMACPVGIEKPVCWPDPLESAACGRQSRQASPYAHRVTFFRAHFRATEQKFTNSLIYMVGGTGIEPVTPAV